MPRVALFVTCVVDTITPDTGVAAVRLLEAAGCTVEFPAAQTCCGQPAVTAGEPEAAARLARHFSTCSSRYDAIVAPSGSCAAMVHHWYTRLLDRGWRERAEAVAARTFELTQYLVDELGVADLGARLDARGHRARRVPRPAQPRRARRAARAARGRRGRRSSR